MSFEESGYTGENNSRLIKVYIDEELRSQRICLEFQKPKEEKKVSEKLCSLINDNAMNNYDTTI